MCATHQKYHGTVNAMGSDLQQRKWQVPGGGSSNGQRYFIIVQREEKDEKDGQGRAEVI